MDLPLSADYIFHALEKEKDRTAWELWKQLYPQMAIGYLKFQSFDDYKEGLFDKEKQCSSKTAEEIEAEMMKVIAAHEGR